MTEPSQRLKCLRCGSHAVRPLQRSARTVSYRVFSALPLPADLPIPTCGRCHAECLDPETTSLLQQLLPFVYESELRRLAEQEIRALSLYVSQRQLELQVGLAQGYLSRLLARSGNPSSALVLLLGLLAKDPIARLSEVQAYWRAPRPEPPLLADLNSASHPLRKS